MNDQPYLPWPAITLSAELQRVLDDVTGRTERQRHRVRSLPPIPRHGPYHAWWAIPAHNGAPRPYDTYVRCLVHLMRYETIRHELLPERVHFTALTWPG